MGGQLPILDVDPNDIHHVFQQLGQMLNITGVLIGLLFTTKTSLIQLKYFTSHYFVTGSQVQTGPE